MNTFTKIYSDKKSAVISSFFSFNTEHKHIKKVCNIHTTKLPIIAGTRKTITYIILNKPVRNNSGLSAI